MLECTCYKILNDGKKEYYSKSTVSPRQKYDISLNIPKDYKLQSVVWKTLYIFDSTFNNPSNIYTIDTDNNKSIIYI